MGSYPQMLLSTHLKLKITHLRPHCQITSFTFSLGPLRPRYDCQQPGCYDASLRPIGSLQPLLYFISNHMSIFVHVNHSRCYLQQL